MFSERFNALMNVAEVSNSLLGRNIGMNPSHIGRLRSGARPLPKKHEYLQAICRYLAGHIIKDYQLNALQKLTGISSVNLSSTEQTVQYLEQWLLEQESDTSAATGRLISGFSRLASEALTFPRDDKRSAFPQKHAAYLYGNEGKRKAVEQFFTMILQEEKPRTLFLFSDENMAWLYEDAVFAARWTDLFKKVVKRGNKVQIIHTVSRDLNEMLEAVTKWIPIYMTGMVEPYFYPRLRDGLFQRTIFLAPDTAAVISSSVQQNTEGMLNFFLTDHTALNALKTEYERYFALCRPLMWIYTKHDADLFQNTLENLVRASGDACLYCAMPPLFALPEKLVRELSKQVGNDTLFLQWKKSLAIFKDVTEKNRLTLILQDPKSTPQTQNGLHPSLDKLFSELRLTYSLEQYTLHIEGLRQLAKQFKNLKLCFVNEIKEDTLLYVKEDTGVVMAKTNAPQTAFVVNERNMVNAFWDYLHKMP